MTQFVAFAPGVEVLGAAVLSVTEGLGPQVLPILARHGLVNVQAEQWYSQQAWLDSFKEISTGTINAMLDLVGIGMKIPETAVFPPGIDSIETGLKSIDVAYHMNHRGGEIGAYQATTVSANQIDVLCQNPYPDNFDYGIIYGMAQRFRPQGYSVNVFHDNAAPCREHGADSCLYHVKWQRD